MKFIIHIHVFSFMGNNLIHEGMTKMLNNRQQPVVERKLLRDKEEVVVKRE